MSNKVKYNLKNVHAAVLTETVTDGITSYSYGTPKPIPGAVSIALDAEGEYRLLAESLGGINVVVSPTSKTIINVFDIETEIIKDEITEIRIDEADMIPKEDVVVLITKDGYIKRTSFRSFTASNMDDLTLKENDYILGLYEMNTTDKLFVFTDGGNYLHIPVHIIPDLKWKDMPKHVSNVIELPGEESVIAAIPAYDFSSNKNLILTTRDGLIKRSKLVDFRLQRYNKASSCMKLKDGDKLISVIQEDYDTIFMTTDTGYGLSFKTDEIPVVGAKASGVKGMKLKDDHIIY